ncbi:MAG: sodium:solute symporter [Bacteroidota bacterium]
MSPSLVATVVICYFLLLIFISWITSRSATAETFYTGNRQSPWYLVAFGMIGASLSGVTFISVPGEVANTNFHYFQVVIGYLLGYAVIALILLPIYYRLQLISIYQFLQKRFGFWSYKMGALFFLMSRVMGASVRLFLVASVLQIAFFDAFGLPFWVAVATAIFLIWIYTLKGGIKTIVWTDTLQTLFMILSVLVSIYLIKDRLDWSWTQVIDSISADGRSAIFDWSSSSTNFFRQFLSGAFIAIAMTGLDQDMMQKNLTCKSLGDAQKNVFWFSVVLIFVNLLFLSLGVLLYQYADIQNVVLPDRTDGVFPTIAIQHLSTFGGVCFLLGITAAAYSSADSALTALTTSFCVDFLGFKPENFHEKRRVRMSVHFGFSVLLFIVILIFAAINSRSVINVVLLVAGYTYGPLLGLFSFGIFTSWKVRDSWVPLVCLISPIASYLLTQAFPNIGFEVLIYNGLFTFVGLFLLRTTSTREHI